MVAYEVACDTKKGWPVTQGSDVGERGTQNSRAKGGL